MWQEIIKSQTSGDSGFESRASLQLRQTCWPNGKAPDYGDTSKRDLWTHFVSDVSLCPVISPTKTSSSDSTSDTSEGKKESKNQPPLCTHRILHYKK